MNAIFRDNAPDEGLGEPTNQTLVAKAVAMSMLFLISMILGTLPIKLSQWLSWRTDAKNNTYVMKLLCFGAGVLLCTTFIHLLPEVREGTENLDFFTKSSLKDLPLAEMLMCAGFFVINFVEEVVHGYLHKREAKLESGFRRSMVARQNGHFHEGNNTGCNHGHADHSHAEKGCASRQQNSFECFPEKNHNHANEHEHEYEHTHTDSHAGHSHLPPSANGFNMRGFLVVLALSVHELFEGLSVGLESETSKVWYMFAAVSMHKFVIAFCIGVELISSGISKKMTVVHVFTFAIVSPLGIGLGMAVSSSGSEFSNIASVILQGFASGTLMYIVFFELLQGDRKCGIAQFCSVLIGFVVMFTGTVLESYYLEDGGH